MLVKRCKFVVCRGCRKIPANPSSLRDEESRRGSHRRPSHPLGDSPLLPPLTPPSLGKNSGLHFSKEPTHPHAWTIGPDAQPDALSPLSPYHRQRPFFCSHACLHVCLLACCLLGYVRARHRRRTSPRLILVLDDDNGDGVWLLFPRRCSSALRVRCIHPRYNGAENNYLFHRMQNCTCL